MANSGPTSGCSTAFPGGVFSGKNQKRQTPVNMNDLLWVRLHFEGQNLEVTDAQPDHQAADIAIQKSLFLQL